MLKIVKESSGRKRLVILPFEDLSPTADNQWFGEIRHKQRVIRIEPIGDEFEITTGKGLIIRTKRVISNLTI